MNEIDANILTAAQHLRSAVALLQAAWQFSAESEDGDFLQTATLYNLHRDTKHILNDTQEQLT